MTMKVTVMTAGTGTLARLLLTGLTCKQITVHGVIIKNGLTEKQYAVSNSHTSEQIAVFSRQVFKAYRWWHANGTGYRYQVRFTYSQRLQGHYSP